jgi:polyisoprenoid-binding protein YceI
LLPTVIEAQTSAVPVFKIMEDESTIKFAVKASASIQGTFDKWDASTDAESGVLDIKIQAASVNTGSGMKDDKLRSKDFSDVKSDPYTTFRSIKIVPTGPTTFDVQGNFTIRGVSKPESLTLTVTGKGTGAGTIQGTMAFDRKEFGMNSGIPFIKIADRVEVNVDQMGSELADPPWSLSNRSWHPTPLHCLRDVVVSRSATAEQVEREMPT